MGSPAKNLEVFRIIFPYFIKKPYKQHPYKAFLHYLPSAKATISANCY